MRDDRLRIVVGCPEGVPLTEARALRDAGHEVIHAGASDAAQLAATAVQEDADLVLVLAATPDAAQFTADVRAALEPIGGEDVEIVTGGSGEVLAAFRARGSAR